MSVSNGYSTSQQVQKTHHHAGSGAERGRNQGQEQMNILTSRGLIVGFIATLALAGCEDGQMPEFLQSKTEVTRASTSNASTSKTIERDVEAPEVFQVADKGLWDGRPSLGGVWVAHPDATDPERVIIRNTTNAKFVVGVLYRPERQQPGPAFQVSSDAAQSLEMLAGQPADLNVTALRSEEVKVGGGDAPAEADDADIAAEQIASAPAVEATALDPIATASAAIDKAEAPSAKAGSTTSISDIAATMGDAPQVTKASASSLAKPFIQIGIFSVQQNADNTSESMRQAGMVPTIKPGKMNGKDFWRVIVGPSGSSSERAQLLKKIKDLGFTDAYFVTN